MFQKRLVTALYPNRLHGLSVSNLSEKVRWIKLLLPSIQSGNEDDDVICD